MRIIPPSAFTNDETSFVHSIFSRSEAKSYQYYWISGCLRRRDLRWRFFDRRISINESDIPLLNLSRQRSSARCQERQDTLEDLRHAGQRRSGWRSRDRQVYVRGGPERRHRAGIGEVVPLDDFWVTANFKETQLAHMRPGQPVEITTAPRTTASSRGLLCSADIKKKPPRPPDLRS
jgi:hypothetical protein